MQAQGVDSFLVEASTTMAGTKLSDPRVSKSKVKDKPYRLSDGGGLFVYVTSDRGKFWRLPYRFQGRPRVLPIGEYPSTTLKHARMAIQNVDCSLLKSFARSVNLSDEISLT